ncbi:type I DNA topoisomerase [Alphaproteobacteria bacterium]|nr:type I DNA topoisomerase [Alphaproteobacteria bacterium]
MFLVYPKTKKSFTARLSEFKGDKVQKFSYSDEASTKKVIEAIDSQFFSVHRLNKKRVQRNPYPPFTTSTLQQEASRKLGLSASRIMQLAQNLYEGISLEGETVGLITYMRTDSVNLGADAIARMHDFLKEKNGEAYVPDSPRFYKNKAKNAQEAHEAIRPTDIFRSPEEMAPYLGKDHLRLYELIWKRALASQMTNAQLDQTTVHLISDDQNIQLKSTGSVLVFDGFLKLYRVSQDEGEEDENKEKHLPLLTEGESIQKEKIIPDQHFTQPPPRFSEASLVKKLEELGIGRPSTYASILQVLRARDYVRLEKKQFIPENRGRLVSLFLIHYFPRYVEYDFTAQMEDTLDEISRGEGSWKGILEKFWTDFLEAVSKTKDLKISQVLDMLDEELSDVIFPKDKEGNPSKACPSCTEGKLHLKLGKYGAFLGCESYPDCKYVHQLVDSKETELDQGIGEEIQDYPKTLGDNPKSGKTISLRKGPYGFYVQEEVDDAKAKPKRSSLPKGLSPSEVTFEKALDLLSLPREVGTHPENQEMILASIGRYGPYIKYKGQFISVKKDDILTLTVDRAVELIEEAAKNPKFKKSSKK